MPAKNVVKNFVENAVYHVYNRGIDKRDIFLDKEDYCYFLKLLKLSLSDPDELLKLAERRPFKESELKCPNFHNQIELLGYCLMPNHFHLLIRQQDRDSITQFMRCVATRYSMYFNLKYNRSGSLFQGVYKAAWVENDSHLLHLSRYIHLNPVSTSMIGFNPENAQEYDYSSYADYLDKRNTKWVRPNIVLNIFREGFECGSKINSYQKFVVEYRMDPLTEIGELSLDSEQ